jgi:hypothetical protein
MVAVKSFRELHSHAMYLHSCWNCICKRTLNPDADIASNTTCQ